MTEPAFPPPPGALSRRRDVAARFRRHPMAMAGALTLGLIVLGVVLGPLVWRLDPAGIDLMARNQGPQPAHPLGTDQLGRDMLARVLAGGRISLAVGFAAMILSLALGTLIGVLAGYVRALDGPLMRITDVFLALPVLPLLLIAVMLFRAPLSEALGDGTGIFVLIVAAIALTSWMPTARIVRGDVLALSARDFITAARSLGTSAPRMITRHILPNVASPILVSASLGIANAILIESALSFLGLGFPPDFASWGRLLSDGMAHLDIAPGRALWPGAAISLTLLGVNYIGEGLRDAGDPRHRTRRRR